MMLDARTMDGLYRQEEVDEAIARGSAVCLVETAKEADKLWSREVPATCSPGGFKKWRPEYSRRLTDADVVLVTAILAASIRSARHSMALQREYGFSTRSRFKPTARPMKYGQPSRLRRDGHLRQQQNSLT